MLCLPEVWAAGRGGVWAALLQFIPLLFLMPACGFVGDAAQWLRRLIRQINSAKNDQKKKSILVFFFLSDWYLAPSTIWLHKYYHCCSKVVLQLSAVPSGHGRLN